MADDLIVVLKNKTLPGLAKEVHRAELACSLKDIQTNKSGGDWKNYAIYKRDGTTPDQGIDILPAPAVGPLGSTKICDGRLTIGENQIPVTAFRLA
jgi:hypothetical protein